MKYPNLTAVFAFSWEVNIHKQGITGAEKGYIYIPQIPNWISS